jgi:hypothetical protein
MNLYKIDGGIGKNIAFTGLIKELVERDGNICIESAYPEIFMGCPGVSMVYHSAEGKDMRKFYSYFDDVYAWDPYIGNMWKGDVHVVDAWANMLGLPKKDLETRIPVLYAKITEDEKAAIDKQLGDGKFYVMQISGGQSPYDIKDVNNLPAYERNHMRTGRNMGMIDPLFEGLTKEFSDYKMVQFGLPNEPKLKGAIQLQLNVIQWMYVFSKADFFVGIDSMMQHYMASINKPGIVFWDMNTPEQFGWKYDGRFNYNTSMPNGVHVNKELADKAINDLKGFLETEPV